MLLYFESQWAKEDSWKGRLARTLLLKGPADADLSSLEAARLWGQHGTYCGTGLGLNLASAASWL